MTRTRLNGNVVVKSGGNFRFHSDLLSQKDYDFIAMHERACCAISKLGRMQREISALMGANVNVPLYKRENLPPTMSNVVKLSEILGVSVHWILTGEPKNDVDYFVISSDGNAHPQACSNNIEKSAIVQGNRNSTIIVENYVGHDLNDQETELIRLFRDMNIKQKAEFLISAYEFE